MNFKKPMALLFIVSQLAACAHHSSVPVEDASEDPFIAECHQEESSDKPSKTKKVFKKIAIGTAVVTGTAIKVVGGVLGCCGRVVVDGAKAQSDSNKKDQ